MNETTKQLVKELNGMSLLGRAVGGDTFVIASLLMGELDDDIMAGLTAHHKAMVKLKPDLGLEQFIVADKLERIKQMFRDALQASINESHRSFEDTPSFRRKGVNPKTLAELKESNKPHPMGTVDQLAKRFNVSKSEIRRRKQDNTLQELLMNQTNKEATS